MPTTSINSHRFMMWSDNKNAELADRYSKAVPYFVKKYGVEPEEIVLPTLLYANNEQTEVTGLTKKPIRITGPFNLPGGRIILVGPVPDGYSPWTSGANEE